jgi:hypothetical protein
MVCPEPLTGGLAVIGCNPALPESNYYAVPLFQPEATDAHLPGLIQLEIDARTSYRYYAPFHRLARHLGLPWEHIDLFFYRETNQTKLKALVTDRDGTLNEFGLRQVSLASRILTLTEPKIILVANAFAARVFKTHFRLSAVDEDGLYWTPLGIRNVPTFLSSTLGGIRPLDSHSLERLLWHMRKTLKAVEA